MCHIPGFVTGIISTRGPRVYKRINPVLFTFHGKKKKHTHHEISEFSESVLQFVDLNNMERFMGIEFRVY